MGEEAEVSEDRFEEVLRKIRDELLLVYEPVRLQMIADFEENMAFLDGITIGETKAPRGRPKRNAFKNASSKITSQANAPAKLRRPDSTDGSNLNIYDHLNQKHDEMIDRKVFQPLKDSTNTISNSILQDTSVILVPDEADKIHKISDDENQMPPPKEPVKVKKRTRKVKKEKISLSEVKTENNAEIPVRRSNRLNTSVSVAKVQKVISNIVVEETERLDSVIDETQSASEIAETSAKIAVPSVQIQNDTIESVYEDAVAINTNVDDKPKVDVLPCFDSIAKIVEKDKKLLRATVSLVRIDTSSLTPVEQAVDEEEKQNEVEVISDVANETFVKGYNPNITHIVKTEVLSPEIQCNNHTVVIQSEEIPPPLDATVIIESNNAINQTFDVQTSNRPEKLDLKNLPKITNGTAAKGSQNEYVGMSDVVVDDSLITDDDSEIDVTAGEKILQKSKPMQDDVLFSSQSPVKCRVKAFEKVIASETPKPMTRGAKKEQILTGKTSTPHSSDGGSKNSGSKLPTSMKKINPATNTYTSNVLTKSKVYTPQTTTKTLKGYTPLTKSTSKNCLSTTNNSTFNTNARNIASGITTFLPKVNTVKPAVVSKEELLKKQQAKEEEVKRKKEQILLDKQEELKRKRMEKERVVQQTRDMQAKEKEKKLVLQQEREKKKNEGKRMKQVKKEEEEAEQKAQAKQQAEEAAEKERKRIAQAQLKAKQLKLKLEEQKNLEKQISSENTNVPKTAMTDGFENLGSDYSTDDDERPPKFPRPQWSESARRQMMLGHQSKSSHKLVDGIFQIELSAPNLREIFPKIQKEKLKRKSSAIWRTPPRYSILQKY